MYRISRPSPSSAPRRRPPVSPHPPAAQTRSPPARREADAPRHFLPLAVSLPSSPLTPHSALWGSSTGRSAPCPPPPLPHGPGSAPAGAAGGDTGSAPERRPPPAPPRADSAFRAARLQAGIWALPAAALPSPPRPSSPLPLSLPPPPSRLRTPAPLSLSISRSLCLNMSQDGGQCGIDVSILEAL